MEAVEQSTMLAFAICLNTRNGCLMRLISIGLSHDYGLSFLSPSISRDGREFVLRLLGKINTLLMHLVVRQSAGELKSFGFGRLGIVNCRGRVVLGLVNAPPAVFKRGGGGVKGRSYNPVRGQLCSCLLYTSPSPRDS